VADELVTVPADLTLLSDSDLSDLEARAVAEFDRLQADDNVTPEILEYQLRLTNDLDRIRAEQAGRVTRAEEAAARERARLLGERADLEARVHGARSAGGSGSGGAGGAGAGASSLDVNQIAEAAARGATAALVAALGQRRLDQNTVTQRATTSLAEARRHQPTTPVPKQRLAVTAGVDIPGVARGSDLVSLDDLVAAVQRTAKGMPITRDGQGQERLVASIRNEFEHTVDDRTSPAQVEELLNHLRRPEKMEALLAGGGWCAPSEIRYEFFNVSDVSGLIDLPTVGITRGGLRFPVSPTIADAFKNDAGATIGLAPFGATFSQGSDPWLWTETDDTASVTGAPLKPTLRVACPSFSEARLECYGITLTAGNLTDDSYPEATAHTLRLLLTAWQHAQNARIISQMVALSSAAITGVGAGSATRPVFQAVMNGLSLATTDYKAKYGMNDDTIVEVVAPFWVQEMIQADLAWRNSSTTDLLSVTDAMINQFAADRQFRVQWVNDYQVRGTGQFGNATTPLTAWPTQADFLVFAAGTFIKGNGLTLDLGVVRDSTLNKTNDFTAAWSEECHLVARVGNESRRYTMLFNVDGGVGGSVYALGSPAAQV
jgi:hypothetical protein